MPRLSDNLARPEQQRMKTSPRQPSANRRAPQFRLGTLLITTGVVGMLCAVYSGLGSGVALCLLMFLLAVLAHVGGNAVGTKMRAEARRVGDLQARPSATPVPQTDFAPVTQLRKHQSLGWPALVFTAVGFLLGGGAGGYYLAAANWQQASVANVAVAVLVSGIISGFFAFLAAGFLQVAFSALRQAQREE